jgi:FAD/FMN-containing dehydrogenase
MESVDAAVNAVAAWRAGLTTLEAAELLFDSGMELVATAFGLSLPLAGRAPVYILVEACDQSDPSDELAEALEGVGGVLDVAVASDSARRAELWRLREDHPLAISTVGVPHKFDVTLPVARLAEFVERVAGVVAAVEPEARVWQFGHIGDGNLHVNVTGVPAEASQLDDAVYGLVLTMDGSISAEHGIGTAKSRYLALDRTPSELRAMQAIKSALDPAAIMNPNAVFQPAELTRPRYVQRTP